MRCDGGSLIQVRVTLSRKISTVGLQNFEHQEVREIRGNKDLAIKRDMAMFHWFRVIGETQPLHNGQPLRTSVESTTRLSQFG